MRSLITAIKTPFALHLDLKPRFPPLEDTAKNPVVNFQSSPAPQQIHNIDAYHQ